MINAMVIREDYPCDSADQTVLCHHNVCYDDLHLYCAAVGD